jgi:cysteinyl-tRNA synthetase
MIAMIARLIETGNAYKPTAMSSSHVPSDPDYGALGRRDRDAKIAARVLKSRAPSAIRQISCVRSLAAGSIGGTHPGERPPGWHIECRR